MPPRLLRLQLILEPLGNSVRSVTFLDLFFPGNGLQSEFLGEAIDFLRQNPVLGFPRLVVCLDLCLELVQRLVGRRRILEEGPIIAQKEMIEELVRDVKVLMLDMSLSTLKSFVEGGTVTYINGGVLLEESLAIFGQSVGDRSASSCLNERIDAVV